MYSGAWRPTNLFRSVIIANISWATAGCGLPQTESAEPRWNCNTVQTGPASVKIGDTADKIANFATSPLYTRSIQRSIGPVTMRGQQLVTNLNFEACNNHLLNRLTRERADFDEICSSTLHIFVFDRQYSTLFSRKFLSENRPSLVEFG